MRRVAAFGRFWWEFVVGDDWTMAAAVLVGVGATVAAAHVTSAAWLILPVVVLGALAASVRRVLVARLRRDAGPGDASGG